MQERLTSRNCYDDEIRPLEYWSIVQMATTVSCNTKSLIVGNGIRQWHSDGFLSLFTSDGTRKLVSLYLSARSLPWNMSQTDRFDSAHNIDTVT